MLQRFFLPISQFAQTQRFPLRSGIILFIALLLGLPALAQIQHGGTPRSSKSKQLKSKSLPMRTLSAIDANKFKALDIKEDVKNRYGVVETVNLNIKEAGTYAEADDYGVWVLYFNCKTALSMSVFLSTFDVPEGAELFVYNADKSVVRGAFNAYNNTDGDGFAIAEIKGGSYIVEYNEPLDAAFQGGVIIESVIKSYANFATKSLPSGSVGINCDAGAEFQNEKRAVARIIYRSGSYSYYCSGSLINNTEMDGTPYFLTANHCISNQTEANSLITYFNYENSTCGSDDANESQTISGATLRATSTYTDFTILKLSENPPMEYMPFFLGWDASGDVPQMGTSIHHPEGSPKCISIDEDPLVSYDQYATWDDNFISDPNTHWQSSYEIGNDKGGSSGCPILNENHLIVGQLHGGNDDISLWGKLSLSWDKNTSSASQIKYWLDPSDTGIKTLQGLDRYAEPSAEFTLTPNPPCASSLITLRPVSAAKSTRKEWTITPETYTFNEGSNKNSDAPKLRFNKADTYSITCTLTTEEEEEEEEVFSSSQEVKITDMLNVKLVDMPDVLDVCIRDLHDFQIEASGAYTYEFEVKASEYFSITTNKNLLTLDLNEEGQKAGSFNTYISVKGTSGDCTSSDKMLLQVNAPTNDNVANAISLYTGITGPYANECGSTETNEPYPSVSSGSSSHHYTWTTPADGSTNPLDNSVWFTLTSPDNGYAEITVSGMENQFALYAGSSPDMILTEGYNTPTLVAAADTTLGDTTHTIFQLSRGVQYYLQVDGRNGAEGEFTVDVKNSTASVFPSISTDGIIKVVLPNLTSGLATISIFSITGVKTYETTANVNENQSTYSFNWGFLKPALYVVHIQINGQTYTSKLLIVG